MLNIVLAACDNKSFTVDCIDNIANQVPGYRSTLFSLGNLVSGSAYSISFLLFFAGGIALLINLILAGIGLMMAAGDPGKIAAGKERIKNGFLGLALLFTAYWIVQLIGLLLGLSGITSSFR